MDALTFGKSIASRDFVGSLDEIRVSKTVRSANWLTTEYNNQKPSSTFLTVGSEVASSGGSANCASSWSNGYGYCRVLTVDHTQVAAALTTSP